MQRHSSCLLFVVAVVLASAGSAARSAATLGDASAVHDWPAVMALGEGAALRLALSAGASTNGRLVSAEAAQITISTGSAKRTLLVPDIRRIAVVERRTKQKAQVGVHDRRGRRRSAGRPRDAEQPRRLGGHACCGWGAIGALIGASDGFFDHEERIRVRCEDTPSPRPFQIAVVHGQRCGAALHNPLGVQACVTVVAGCDAS